MTRTRLGDTLRQNLRFGVRSLGRQPGFTLVAIITLALGIGASTAMFSVLSGVLLRPLPVRDQEELVVLWTAAPSRTTSHLFVSWADLTAFRSESRTFAGLAGVAYQGAVELMLTDGGSPVRVDGTWVTGDFFPLLGITPLKGRLLGPADDVPGAPSAAVISHGFWRRYFGGDPAAVGHELDWNGKRVTVVGVLPPGFQYPKGADLWLPVLPSFPATLDPRANGAVAMIFDLVGRLRPTIAPPTAGAEFDAFLRRRDALKADSDRGTTAVVAPLADRIAGDAAPFVWTGAGAVALLLLISCLNVANLLLVRGMARSHELAIRSALGAGRRRLVAQLLTESGLLGLIGGALGLILAIAATGAVGSLAPPELPRRETIAIDTGVLLFAAGTVIAAVLLSGLLPAILATRTDPGRRLREGRGAVGGRSGGSDAVRHALVIGQVTLAILVVTVAGLLTRSLIALESVDLGFERQHLLVGETAIPGNLVPDRARQVGIQEAMVRRVALVPGVVAVTTMPQPPFSGQQGWIAFYTGEGQTPAAQAANPWVNFEVVDAGYFRTLQIPLVRGRSFAEADRPNQVVVVSAGLADRTWPGEDPLEKRIALGGAADHGPWYTVVGVAGETRYHDLREAQASFYLPAWQFDGPLPMTLAVRTAGDPTVLIPAIRAALAEVHPALVLASGGAVRDLLATPLARPRFGTLLLGTFAAITLLLAAVGIYGTLSATIRHRTREIGIRLALGATGGTVRASVLGQGMKLAAWGAAGGIAVALAGTRLLQSMLFGVTPTDPLTMVTVLAVVLGTAALACWLPARRATRVDPMLTLRGD